MNKEIKIVLLITLHLLVPGGMEASGQDRQRADSQGIYQTRVEPSKDYLRSGFHRFLFGRHYRREWVTPVTLPSIRLDSGFGLLTPY